MPDVNKTVTKTESNTNNSNLSSDEMMTAILAYLGLLVLVPLFAIDKSKRNDFITFHLQQGLNLLIIEIILWVIVSILTIITFGILGFIAWIIWLLILIVVIIAIIKATQKEKW